MPDRAAVALPQSPDAITPAWLTSALRAAGAIDASARVASLASRPVEVGGVNGEVYRLTLEYGGGEGPRTLIAKFPATSDAARGVATYQRWYEREAGAYRDLHAGAGRLMPACHFAAAGEEGFLLLLEDLGAMRQGDQVAGCSPEEAEAAVRAIAPLHARWWAHPSLEGHPWLPLTTVGLDRSARIQGALARSWSVVRTSYPLPAGIEPVADRLVEAYPDLLGRAASAPVTVVHGDYRLDNLFFDADGEVTAIDWQFTCRCRGAYDVAYLIGLDLVPDDRRAHEERLLDAYVASIASLGVEDYSIEDCRRDYRLCLLLAFATFVIGAAGHHDSPRARLVHEVGLDRLARAILDHEHDMQDILAG